MLRTCLRARQVQTSLVLRRRGKNAKEEIRNRFKSAAHRARRRSSAHDLQKHLEEAATTTSYILRANFRITLRRRAGLRPAEDAFERATQEARKSRSRPRRAQNDEAVAQSRRDALRGQLLNKGSDHKNADTPKSQKARAKNAFGNKRVDANGVGKQVERWAREGKRGFRTVTRFRRFRVRRDAIIAKDAWLIGQALRVYKSHRIRGSTFRDEISLKPSRNLGTLQS